MMVLDAPTRNSEEGGRSGQKPIPLCRVCCWLGINRLRCREGPRTSIRKPVGMMPCVVPGTSDGGAETSGCFCVKHTNYRYRSSEQAASCTEITQDLLLLDILNFNLLNFEVRIHPVDLFRRKGRPLTKGLTFSKKALMVKTIERSERSLPHSFYICQFADLGDLHLYPIFFDHWNFLDMCRDTQPKWGFHEFHEMSQPWPLSPQPSSHVVWGLLWRRDVFALPVFWMMGREAKEISLKDGFFGKLSYQVTPGFIIWIFLCLMESSPPYRVLFWMLQSQEQLVQTILFPQKKPVKTEWLRSARYSVVFHRFMHTFCWPFATLRLIGRCYGQAVHPPVFISIYT